MASSRETRLLADLETLELLRDSSTILDFTASGDPPEQYAVLFREMEDPRDLPAVSAYRCEIDLPPDYPHAPPRLRWTTPVVHLNVPADGVIHPGDIDLAWDEHCGLDQLCEKLWDVLRWKHYDLENIVNQQAADWYEEQGQWILPLDDRPLRDAASAGGRNIIRYQWKEEALNLPPGSPITPTPPAKDVMFINDDAADEGVLYISDAD